MPTLIDGQYVNADPVFKVVMDFKPDEECYFNSNFSDVHIRGKIVNVGTTNLRVLCEEPNLNQGFYDIPFGMVTRTIPQLLALQQLQIRITNFVLALVTDQPDMRFVQVALHETPYRNLMKVMYQNQCVATLPIETKCPWTFNLIVSMFTMRFNLRAYLTADIRQKME